MNIYRKFVTFEVRGAIRKNAVPNFKVFRKKLLIII